MRERTRKEDELVQSFEVKPGGRLTAKLDVGSIHVQGGDSERVEIRIKRVVEADEPAEVQRLFDACKFDLSQRGKDVTVRIKAPSRKPALHWLRRSHERLELTLTVTCPRRYDVDLDTLTGGIWVDGLAGEVRASASSGGVVLGDIDGAVFADSNAGSIRTGRIKGRVVARTLSGGIRVREVTDGIDAESHSGGVMACLSAQPQGDCRLTSVAGDLVVHLAEEVHVDVDARVGAGRVLTEFPLDSDHSYKVRDKIHGGGPKLRLRVSAGNIHLKRMARIAATPAA
jgi:hypothetical protein